jgi:hypothetical protein
MFSPIVSNGAAIKMPAAAASNMERTLGVSSWMTCSVGMMIFNKLAVQGFPLACTLVAFQMFFSVLVMAVCCWQSLHIGSLRDVMKWSVVIPFYTGMLLSSILALKFAPMTLVVTFRGLSPLVSLFVERFYPSPLRVTPWILSSVAMMVVGCVVYTIGMDHTHFKGAAWAVLNVFFAVGDRLLQRLMLSKDQQPVDISKTGLTLLNNLLGMVPLAAAAALTGEFVEVPGAIEDLHSSSSAATKIMYILASCIVGVGISYTGIWTQSLISATSFLVLVNANKFLIVFIDAFILKTKNIHVAQVIGASITIMAGISYGKAQEAVTIEEAAKSEETHALKP